MPLLLEAFAAEKVLVADLVGPALVQRLDILDHPSIQNSNVLLHLPARKGGCSVWQIPGRVH